MMKPLFPLLLFLTCTLALRARMERPALPGDGGHEPTELRGTGCVLPGAWADRMLYDYTEEWGDDVNYLATGKSAALASVRHGAHDFAILPLNAVERQRLANEGLWTIGIANGRWWLVMKAEPATTADGHERHAATRDLALYLHH